MIVARDVYVGMHKRIADLEAALAVAVEFVSEERRAFIECATLPNPDGTRRVEMLDDLEKTALAEYDAPLLMARDALGLGPAQ